MIDSLPAAPDPASDVPAVFNAKAAAFVLAQKAMVDQINATTANLNSIAVGGAYTIPFLGAPTGQIGANAGGKFALGGITGSEATATSLYVDVTSAAGTAVANMLDSITSSSSPVKAAVRLVKQSDPTQFLLFNITAVTVFTYYRIYTVQCVANGPNPSPFGDNDLTLFQFQRTGEKGETGTYPQMLIRDQGASGYSPQSLAAGWNVRRFNSTNYNDLPSVTLSGNIITLGYAGRYRFSASAPASSTNAHSLRLWNASNSTTLDVGGNEFAASNVAGATRATLLTVLTLPAGIQLRLDHFANVAGNGGIAVSNGLGEIYTEMLITKLT